MITQVVARITFGMLAVIALAGLVDAVTILIKIARSKAEPGTGEWFGSHVFLLRMIPRPNAIFLGVMVLSLVDFLFSRWLPLAWLALACLIAAVLYREAEGLLRWAYGDPKPQAAAEVQGLAVSQPGASAPAGTPAFAAARQPSKALQAFAAATGPGFAARLPNDRDARLIGAVFLAGSALAGYIFIFRPIWEAIQGAPSVRYYGEAIMLVPIAAAAGLVYLVFGARAYPMLQKRPKGLALILMIVVGLVYAFGCMAATDFVFNTLGYG